MADTDIKDDQESGNDPAPVAAPEAEPEQATEAPSSEPAPDPLVEAKAEAARLRDQLLRTAADFDNFRKRSRKEIAEAEARSREDLLRELLPVFDNLERAMQHAESATSVQSLADGIRMVQKQFVDTLGKLDVVRVESVGNPFDPAVHEAIQHIETDDHPPGTVAAEARSGYRHGDRLLRPALVVVAKAAAPPPPDSSDDASGGDSGSDSETETEES